MGAPEERWAGNPFFVLELSPTATRAEIERAGAKLLAMLGVEMKSAAIYATPVGPRVRTAELVRAAMADLRDPERRAVHEAWWVALSDEEDDDHAADDDRDDVTGSGESGRFAFDAPGVLGWRR